MNQLADKPHEDELRPIPRQHRNPYNVAAQALNTACDFWLWLHEQLESSTMGSPEEYFWKECFGKTFHDPDTDGDDAVTKIGTLLDGTYAEDGNAPFALLQVMGVIVDYSVQAMTSEKAGSHDIAWSYASDAQYWAGILRANLAQKSEPSPLSTNAIKAALKRWDQDPKKQEKLFIYDCWTVWQEEPERYKSKAAFARAMLSSPNIKHLTSQKKIEDWCREWEKSSSMHSDNFAS
ncbi:MAG TPA: hypothetical protein VFF74_00750 [Methylophilaceae bacterium]|nr:hypothetical protein [Methylophilaceae bacterium]